MMELLELAAKLGEFELRQHEMERHALDRAAKVVKKRAKAKIGEYQEQASVEKNGHEKRRGQQRRDTDQVKTERDRHRGKVDQQNKRKRTGAADYEDRQPTLPVGWAWQHHPGNRERRDKLARSIANRSHKNLCAHGFEPRRGWV